MNFESNYSLKQHNSLGLSVTTRFWAQADSSADIRTALVFAKNKSIPLLVLGEGSNLIIADDYPGLVLKIAIMGRSMVKEDENNAWVRVGAGENWHAFVQWSLANNLYGLENLSLIPGSVGAAPIQNIGAYGVELCSCFYQLQAISRKTGESQLFTRDVCQFAYRNSVFKETLLDRFIITDVTLRLLKTAQLKTGYGAVEEELKAMQLENYNAQAVAEAICRIRRRKLPDPQQLSNVGSFFKNPMISRREFDSLKVKFPQLVGYVDGDQVKVAAGWLIQYCGWKGYRAGAVGVHTEQALVLVNYGGAQGEEILALAQKIQDSVAQSFGIELELEPRVYP